MANIYSVCGYAIKILNFTRFPRILNALRRLYLHTYTDTRTPTYINIYIKANTTDIAITMPWSGEQRGFVIEAFFKNAKCVTVTQRAFRTQFDFNLNDRSYTSRNLRDSTRYAGKTAESDRTLSRTTPYMRRSSRQSFRRYNFKKTLYNIVLKIKIFFLYLVSFFFNLLRKCGSPLCHILYIPIVSMLKPPYIYLRKSGGDRMCNIII
ncbi:hypothetical protein AGLY_013141 [Aphis glycines]|uniref:DUF4817 domain-containing protein n=1 Tax=Aphis glycines TaxID=307491 RepID=A0A6G0T6B3_APHGL|nr:hypothetical protein AGLY_013141 [Aphis glycines]